MTDAQINNLIARAHGPQAQAQPAAWPQFNAAPAVQGHAQIPPAAAWFPGAGGFGFGGTLFNMFGGGHGNP